jgi:hypothetical protein
MSEGNRGQTPFFHLTGRGLSFSVLETILNGTMGDIADKRIVEIHSQSQVVQSLGGTQLAPKK